MVVGLCDSSHSFSSFEVSFSPFQFRFLSSFIINSFPSLSYSTGHLNDPSLSDVWISIDQWKCSSLFCRSIFHHGEDPVSECTYPWVWMNWFSWMISEIGWQQVRALIVASLLPMIESRFSIQCVLCLCHLPYSRRSKPTCSIAKILPGSEISSTGWECWRKLSICSPASITSEYLTAAVACSYRRLLGFGFESNDKTPRKEKNRSFFFVSMIGLFRSTTKCIAHLHRCSANAQASLFPFPNDSMHCKLHSQPGFLPCPCIR